MLKYIIVTMTVAAAMGLSMSPALSDGYANRGLLMNVEKLSSILETDEVVLIDVRPREDFMSGHLPGAVHLAPDAVADPVAPIGGALKSTDEIAGLLGRLGVSARSQVVLYDDKGGFHAARMFWLLEYFGHRNVSLLNGGIQAWTRAGLETNTGGDGPAPERTFSAALSPRRFASAEWILEREKDAETVVIDVRTADAFQKGHIPWAVNIPWKANLNEDQTLKSAEALSAHFASLGISPDDNIVVHCENGLASSHSYFALRLLGYPRVRTYHRSWSEWGSAGDLPVAVSGG